jgi:hypothetical protein
MHHEDISGVCCIFINWPYPQLVDVFHYDNHITLLFVHNNNNEKLNWFPKPLPKFIILRIWLQIEIGYTNNIHDAKYS